MSLSKAELGKTNVMPSDRVVGLERNISQDELDIQVVGVIEP
jgi:hypothetical protein